MNQNKHALFAYGVSLVMHLGVIALLFVNASFDPPKPPKPLPGQSETLENKPIVQAQMVDQGRIEAAREKIREREKEKKAKAAAEKRKTDKALAEAKAKREAEEKKAQAAKRKRLQEEEKAKAAAKRRKEEEAKKQALAKKREKEEAAIKAAEKKRLAEEKKAAELAAKRKKQEEEEKRKKEALEAEKRRQELEEQMLAEMAAEEAKEAERAAAAARRQAQVLSEVEKYESLIKNKINNNWVKHMELNPCTMKIKIGAGGVVLNTERLSGDQRSCEAAKRAVLNSEPLPVPKDQDVFNKIREMRILFDDSDS